MMPAGICFLFALNLRVRSGRILRGFGCVDLAVKFSSRKFHRFLLLLLLLLLVLGVDFGILLLVKLLLAQ